MAIFAVTAPESNAKIEPAMASTFPDQFIKVWQGHWFVIAVGTAKEVYNKIEANTPDKKPGTVVVVSVANYWGVANPEVWEWLKSRLEKK
jgi:hypothetical protein